MSHKASKYQRHLALIIAAAGICLLIAGAFYWQRGMGQRHRTSELNDRIADINRTGVEIADPQQLKNLIETANQQKLYLPEGEYALLHRQWLQAVTLFDELRNTLANPYLTERSRTSAADFHARLLQLRDALAESLVDHQDLPLEWQWKLHNLKGNTAVLLAYSVLYHEKDGRKAAKFLIDALGDYKIAIRQVDEVSLSSFERALPRWNLELIVAVGEYRRLGLSEIPPADITQVQEQLQTYIPEAPGFSPGAPAETRVEK
jgi:hypothetical protein